MYVYQCFPSVYICVQHKLLKPLYSSQAGKTVFLKNPTLVLMPIEGSSQVDSHSVFLCCVSVCGGVGIFIGVFVFVLVVAMAMTLAVPLLKTAPDFDFQP